MSIGVYIHVPYCKVACPYCDFVKKGVDGGAPPAFDGILEQFNFLKRIFFQMIQQ